MSSSRAVLVGASFVGGLVAGTVYHRLMQHEDIHVEYQEKKTELTKTLFPNGVPERAPHVAYYKNFALCYDNCRKIPHWVAEHITMDKLKGKANRRHSKFKPDPTMPSMFNAENSDYWKSGWSRGHMAPAGDSKHDQEAMDESFYLTNVLPQDLNNNGVYWNRMEMYCRELAERYPNVWVVSGPVILPETHAQNGKQYVQYEVIGKNQVAAPTHLFKVIVVDGQGMGKTKLMSSFIVPNKPIGFAQHLKEFEVPLEYVEERTGFRYMPKLKRDETKSLCAVDGCNLISKEKFELYFIGRKVEGARTIERLEKAWGELKEKKLTPDDYLKNAYSRKKAELSEESSRSQQQG